MTLNKQAKTITKQQQEAILAYLGNRKLGTRNRVIFLLSARAGLRAKEIASVTWSMITDAQGEVSDAISLENAASKGNSGGKVWLNTELKAALRQLKEESKNLELSNPIVLSNRNKPMSAQQIVNIFRIWYRALGFDGCSSHSGRRTFITNAARKISTVGGSIRDVQMLARHSSMNMTQRYIECDIQAQKRVVNII